MRAAVVITDADAMKSFERAFLEEGRRGFTILPTLAGRGRTGLKTGDRIHPGGSSLLFTVVPDEDAPDLVRFLRRVAEGAGTADATKIYLAQIEEA